MATARGPGHIAFSRDVLGKTVALPIQPGQSIDAREYVFIVATGQVNYGLFQTGVWFTTQKEMDYRRIGLRRLLCSLSFAVGLDRFLSNKPRTVLTMTLAQADDFLVST